MLQEGLEKAKALKLPISHEETLFSTPEDRRDMEGEAVMQLPTALPASLQPP